MSQNPFHGSHCSTSQMVDFVGATYINNNNAKGVWVGGVVYGGICGWMGGVAPSFGGLLLLLVT
jgi:hypothetical protein